MSPPFNVRFHGTSDIQRVVSLPSVKLNSKSVSSPRKKTRHLLISLTLFDILQLVRPCGCGRDLSGWSVTDSTSVSCNRRKGYSDEIVLSGNNLCILTDPGSSNAVRLFLSIGDGNGLAWVQGIILTKRVWVTGIWLSFYGVRARRSIKER